MAEESTTVDVEADDAESRVADIPQAVVDQALDAAEAGCKACDVELAGIVIRLVEGIEKSLIIHQQLLDKIVRRITRSINREQGIVGNVFEGIGTKLNNELADGLFGQQNLLDGVKDKLSLPDSAALNGSMPGGTFTIDLEPLVKLGEKLVEVLSEIRDRLPGPPHIEKGDLPDSEFKAYSPASVVVSGDGLGDSPVATAQSLQVA